MKRRRQHTREFKLSILHELEVKPAAQVCREHDLHPSLITQWKRAYEKNPREAFSGHGNAWKDKAKINRYKQLMGELYAENAFLKNVLERLKIRLEEERRKR